MVLSSLQERKTTQGDFESDSNVAVVPEGEELGLRSGEAECEGDGSGDRGRG